MEKFATFDLEPLEVFYPILKISNELKGVCKHICNILNILLVTASYVGKVQITLYLSMNKNYAQEILEEIFFFVFIIHVHVQQTYF